MDNKSIYKLFMALSHLRQKGYLLFCCLGRMTFVSMLSLTTPSTLKAASMSDEVWHADSAQTTKEVLLGDIGVTGSRTPLTKSRAARMVTVLTHEDIEAAPVQSVSDLLKMALGVDVRQRGVMGTQTDVSIRGGTQEQIAVLLNGINICDPQTGHNVMDLPVQLSEIVRIEVLEGPAARVYGTASLVGAINIVTHPAPESGGLLEAEGGSYGYGKVAGKANWHQGQWNNQLSGSYQRSDGYSRSAAGTLNTDYSGMKGFYQGQYDDEHVLASWHLGMASKGWGSSTFYASPRWQADDQYEHTTKLTGALQAETKQGVVRFRPTLYWNQHRDRYEGYRGRPDLMAYNYNRCNVLGISLHSWFDSPIGRTAMGAELRNEDLKSGNLGEPLLHTEPIGGTNREYTRGIDRTNISAHLEHHLNIGQLTLSAGFVAAKSSWSSEGMRLYPGVDVAYRMPLAHTELKAFASWNTSMRYPSFTEMYYKLQGYAADPHLKPEEMQAIEVGGQLTADAFEAKAACFLHRGRRMIDWVMDTSLGNEATWESVNHTEINAYGIEAYARLNLGSLFPSQTLLRSLCLSYSYIQQDKEAEQNIVSQYALEYLRHKLVGHLVLSPFRRVTLSMDVRWQDRVGSYTTFQNEVRSYQPFALVDARLSWQTPKMELYVQANNVLDNRNYVDYGNVPQPGIWMIAGMRYGFRF